MKRLLLSLALVLLAAPLARAVEIVRVTSPGGIEAWLIEAHDNPLFALSFSMPGGAALDPKGKEGLTLLLASTIDEGAGDLDSEAFRQEMEDRSISLSFSTGQDSFTGTLQGLTRERDRAFELLHLALTQPRFDEEPIQRVKSQIESILARAKQNPDSIAGEALARLTFGQHPYAFRKEGTPESLAGLTADDLRQLAKERLQRNGLIIGVVGDITPEELAPLLDATFGALPIAEIPPVTPAFTFEGQGVVQVIPFPGPQSVIQMAQPAIKRDDPDFYAARVVDQVLGGGSFTSRLYLEVREKRGLAYGAWSSLTPRQAGGLWYAGASTKNESAGETLEIMREVWAQMAKEGPSDEEIQAAIDYLTGSFALSLTSSPDIADLLVSIQREKLGIDYIDKRAIFYDTLTPDQVRQVAKRLLDPAKLAIVVVGEPVGIEATAP